MFDPYCPYNQIPYDVVECDAHLEEAYESILKSTVLIKNDHFLPLDQKNYQTIAVIGPNANSRRVLLGNYHGTASRYITNLEGIQDAYKGYGRVYYSEGTPICKPQTEALTKERNCFSEAKTIANLSDLIILCLGLDSTIEGEDGDAGNAYPAGDKESLRLLGLQQELLLYTKKEATRLPIVKYCIFKTTHREKHLNFKEALLKFDFTSFNQTTFD